MKHNFKVGQRIVVKEFHDRKGTIKKVSDRKVWVLMDTTTTGNLSEFSLRNNGYFVAVGWSKDEMSFGGYFKNEDQEVKISVVSKVKHTLPPVEKLEAVLSFLQAVGLNHDKLTCVEAFAVFDGFIKSIPETDKVSELYDIESKLLTQ